MSWTAGVECGRCSGFSWRVEAGAWTCDCGKQMTVAEIAKFHARAAVSGEAEAGK